MRILIIGDIVGRPGKRACAHLVPRLIQDEQLDCVIANAENTAAGSGLTPQMFTKLRHYGIDCCTMGDHIYKRRELIPMLRDCDRIVRPANLSKEAVGREFTTFDTTSGTCVGVISVLGRTYMSMKADCPYHAVDRCLRQMPDHVRVVVVDMHAEATSEKIAMGWHLDGRASVVVGTHTHVPTGDERILPRGTAYITDLGMTGPYDSVLGRDKDRVVKSLVTGMPQPYDVASDDIRLSGVIVDVDPASGRSKAIRRVFQSHDDAAHAAVDDSHGD